MFNQYRSDKVLNKELLLEIRDLLGVVLSAYVVCYLHVFLISWSLGAI